MPTYKETLRKLKEKKKIAKSRLRSGSRQKPRKKPKPKPKPKPKKIHRKVKPSKGAKKAVKKRRTVKKVKPKKKTIKKSRIHKKRALKKKPTKRKKPKKKVIKRKPRKKVVKLRPKKSRGSSITRKKRVSGKKPVKRKAKKTKPRKKPTKKKVLKKLRRKPKSAAARRRKGLEGKPTRRPRKKKPTKPRIYIGKGTLDQLFESQAKVKLLKFFFRNAEEMFQPKEIFKRLRSNIALLRQEMKKLEKIGLLKQKKAWLSFEKKRGGVKKERKTVWHLNPNFDFFNELRDLVLKSTIASKDELVERAKKIGTIKLLVLSGVFTGDETARADLLIVGDKINHRKLTTFIKDLEAEVGKEINCAVMNSKEFDYRYDMYDRFIRDLLDGKCEILVKKIELW